MNQEIEFNQVYNKIQELLKSGKNTISVLEEQVDVELQLEYFKTSRKLYNKVDKEVVLMEKNQLTESAISIDVKKELLSSLAKIDDPSAFRALETYKENPDAELEQWSKLAYQESKMVLETSLLGEAPIFISTGLGGKGSQLRYFIVLVANESEALEEWQQNLVRKELNYFFERDNGELEQIDFDTDLVLITGLLPIAINIKDTLTSVVKECNELGGFLKKSFIVTNVKKLEINEVRNMVNAAQSKEDSSEDGGSNELEL
ncbi:hypothetical protein [Labilibacter marinus]|uniref:hypothetical protein n=1 Tax=Labilibacter marinus TaxID=1477105 RepID=UPI000836F780|nr:hypothetical protein [Labilibacter marinus]